MPQRLRLKIRDDAGYARLDAAVIERLIAGLEGGGEAILVTLESDGDAFCEGMNLSGFVAAPEEASARLERFADLLRAISRAPRPVIALVNGPALGGGVGLAAAADIVLASPHASFSLPETLFGLIPAIVFPVIARRVGPSRARFLALSAVTIRASEAWRLGLVDEVAEDLEAALERYARRFDRMDPHALAEVKALTAAFESTPPGYRDEAIGSFRRLLSSTEVHDRIARFNAGETPWPDPEAL